MKKYIYGLAIIVSLSMIIMLPVKGYARWFLYDNFNSNQIDPELWDIDEFPATITVENGEARFDHDTTIQNDSSWLIFKNPERIKAVKVTVRFADECCGDVRGRIGCDLGKIMIDGDEYFIWQTIQSRNQYDRIDNWVGPYDPDNPNEDQGELFYSRFPNPIENFIGYDFTIEARFNRKMIQFRVPGLGYNMFIPKQRILKHEEGNYWVGIGTRNSEECDNSEDPCTVYFDDVYVIY